MPTNGHHDKGELPAHDEQVEDAANDSSTPAQCHANVRGDGAFEDACVGAKA